MFLIIIINLYKINDMKKSIFVMLTFLCTLFLFYSCSDVMFQKPQPTWITANEAIIPKNLQGIYADGKDTILISDKRIMDNKINHDFDLNLSDTVLLKIYNNTYFLNTHDPDKKNWVVIMSKAEKNALIVSMISLKDSSVLNKLKNITSVKETKDANGKVTDCILNPTDDEFRKILNQHLFIPIDTLRKVN
jgi:hypothetical protein